MFKLKIKASDAARTIGEVDENETISDYIIILTRTRFGV